MKRSIFTESECEQFNSEILDFQGLLTMILSIFDYSLKDFGYSRFQESGTDLPDWQLPITDDHVSKLNSILKELGQSSRINPFKELDGCQRVLKEGNSAIDLEKGRDPSTNMVSDKLIKSVPDLAEYHWHRCNRGFLFLYFVLKMISQQFTFSYSIFLYCLVSFFIFCRAFVLWRPRRCPLSRMYWVFESFELFLC